MTNKLYINSKKYVKFGCKLDDIIKYTTGWKNTLNKSNKKIDKNDVNK